MEDLNNLYIAWLKDAYAMERALEETLRIHASQAEDYPMVEEKIAEHLEITQRQIDRLKNCLEEKGEDTSVIKNISGEIMGRIQGHSGEFSKDKIIKNALMDSAAEAFEIACYNALILTAEKLGDE